VSNPAPLYCLAHFAFGEGKLTVQSGSIYGNPCLILAPAKHIGVPGADASKTERSAVDPEVMRESVVLSFKNEKHRDAVERALLGFDLC
jgi:hypothetical protein